MFLYAHFYTFPYNLLIDPKSLNRPLIFEYEGFEIRLNSPYKSYAYNHDFSHKPIYYINSKGRKINLPLAKGFCSYPMYDEDLNHIGMFLQENEVYSFEKAMRMKLAEDLPDKLFEFKPVDTIRFDTTKHFNFDTPKFIDTFISHLRNISGQFWLGKPRVDNEGVSIEGILKSNGSIENFQFHSNLIPIIRYNKGIPVDFEMWEEAVTNTVDKVDINFARSLFLDAIYENSKNNYREVVLNIANSLDITLNIFLKKIHDKTNLNEPFDRQTFVKNNRSRKGISDTYLPGLVGDFLTELIGQDYKDYNPDSYETIRLFWLNKRNPVAHGSQVSLESNEITEIFDAADNLTEWINHISI